MSLYEFLLNVGVGAVLGASVSFYFNNRMFDKERAATEIRETKAREHALEAERNREWRSRQINLLDQIFRDFDSIATLSLSLRSIFIDNKAIFSLTRNSSKGDRLDHLLSVRAEYDQRFERLFDCMQGLDVRIEFLDDSEFQKVARDTNVRAGNLANGAKESDEDHWGQLHREFRDSYRTLKELAIPTYRRIMGIASDTIAESK